MNFILHFTTHKLVATYKLCILKPIKILNLEDIMLNTNTVRFKNNLNETYTIKSQSLSPLAAIRLSLAFAVAVEASCYLISHFSRWK